MPDPMSTRLLIFCGLLSIQYHPRNDVSPDDDAEVISRCLNITDQAVGAFNHYFDPDRIPF